MTEEQTSNTGTITPHEPKAPRIILTTAQKVEKLRIQKETLLQEAKDRKAEIEKKMKRIISVDKSAHAKEHKADMTQLKCVVGAIVIDMIEKNTLNTIAGSAILKEVLAAKGRHAGGLYRPNAIEKVDALRKHFNAHVKSIEDAKKGGQ
jgi:mannose-1-phosphate guanylyltransferase